MILTFVQSRTIARAPRRRRSSSGTQQQGSTTVRGPLEVRRKELKRNMYARTTPTRVSAYLTANSRTASGRKRGARPTSNERKAKRVRLSQSVELKQTKAELKGALTENEQIREELSTLKTTSQHQYEALQGDLQRLLMTEGSLDERFRPYLNEEGEFDFRQETERGGVSIAVMLAILLMGLLELGVTENLCWPITAYFILAITGHKVAHGLTRKFLYNIVERLDVLANMQIAFLLVGYMLEDIAGICAPHDGTSYAGRHIAGRALNIGGTNVSLGMEDVPDGTAMVAFAAFYAKLVLICDSIKDTALYLDINQVLLRIKHSLNDACSVETKWARALENKKFSTINAMKEYDDLSEEEKMRLAAVLSHFVHRCFSLPLLTASLVSFYTYLTELISDHSTQRCAQVFVWYCMAHCLSGLTEQLDVHFKIRRKQLQSKPLYDKSLQSALREISKAFHSLSAWGFQLSVVKSSSAFIS
jgi:hypothetical protein